MKKILAYSFVLSCMFATVVPWAKEPANLALIKKDLITYHDSGAYERDLNNVIAQSMRYLQIRFMRKPEHNTKPAMVLDIDETALSNYPSMVERDFGGTIEQFRQSEDQGNDSVIQPTLKLYRFAKAHHVAVFFITGRTEEERAITVNNLKKAGYDNWDGLILRDGIYKKSSAVEYKTAMRKQIVNQGYDIILNIGDQKSDLVGNYADKTFKLPNPYYFIG